MFDTVFDEKKLESVKSDYIVYKPNPLLLVRDDLSLMQARFFTVYLSKIEPGKPETYKVRFSLNDFCQLVNCDTSSIKRLKDDCQAILSTNFDFVEYNRRHSEVDPLLMRKVNLFESFFIEGSPNDGYYVEITPTRPLEHLFENQDKYGYVSYYLENSLLVSTKRHMRMYEFFKRHVGKGVNIDISNLKAYLGLEEQEYPDLRDFRGKVIDKGVKEINEKTDIYVTYKPFKRGPKGKILSFTFTISSKAHIPESDFEDVSNTFSEQEEINIIDDNNDEPIDYGYRDEICCGFSSEIFNEFTDEDLKLFMRLAAPHITEEMKSKYDHKESAIRRELATSEFIATKISIANAKPNIESRLGFIKAAIANNYSY